MFRHWFSTLIRRSVFRRAKDDRDLDDEIRFHLAEETRLRAERGMPIDDAARDARRAFGSVALAKESTRAVWVSTALEQLLQDLRFGCRILTKSPALSATAVTLVALVIGGNTTIFSIANGILSKPLPGVHANDLVTVKWITAGGQVSPVNSYVAYRHFTEHSQTVRPLVAFDWARMTLTHEAGSYAVNAGLVSPNYFDGLGVRLVKGRSFTVDEAERSVSGLVVVIGHHIWRDYFQASDDVIGRPVSLNGHPATIIGVTEPLFRGAMLGESADIWVPLIGELRARGRERLQLNRTAVIVTMIGRLARGVSRTQAEAELAALWTQLQAAIPELNQKLRLTLVPYSPTAGGDSLVALHGVRSLAIFQIVTLITILIVCANVANLLISRAVIRQREMALRQSLGASRVRIIRTLLAEGLTLAVVAWAAACGFAWWVSKAVTAYIVPLDQSALAVPDFAPDWTVIGYALGLAVLCTVAFTVAPALRAWHQELLPWLKAGEQGVVQGRSRLSTALVVTQLAFSVLLLTCAGLAYRSLSLAESLDLGFPTKNTLLATVNTSGVATSPESNAALIESIHDRLRRVPGIERVSYARKPQSEHWGTPLEIRSAGSAAEPARAADNHVGPDYLQALGVSLVAGREFSIDEGSAAARTVFINRAVADELWPGQPPVGRRVLIGRGKQTVEAEVVGVAEDAFFTGNRFAQQSRYIFLSAQQDPALPGQTTFYVRYSGSLDTIAPAVGRAIRDVDPRVPIANLRTMDSQLAVSSPPFRLLAMLLMLFAGGSLLIATIGQYAVVAFDMRRRARELGLRIALGASSTQMLSSILRDGFRFTAVGLTIGFALSLAVGRALGGFLYGITPTDPVTYLGVFALLCAASLLASYLPARRAARIDPITILRSE